MERTFEFHNSLDTRTCKVTFDDKDITECPLCHKSFSPFPITGCVYMGKHLKETKNYCSIVFLCRSCCSVFLAKYDLISCTSNISVCQFKTNNLLSVDPVAFKKEIFDSNLVELSPQFDKIYNQASAAESSGLDEIAGLGYRKAMEFLIKDFAIHTHPQDEEEIKSSLLAACINKYIDNSSIKTLASRSAWIGNDEAHYLRKQENRDVSDMKKFIQAIVYYTGMYLITEDAASIEPVK